MKQPLVTVVIPIYNVEKYLKECFDSVVNQSYENLEIILVNDGSTDTSGEIADRIAMTDDRAFVIHKKNGGLSDARNAAMEVAKGEYITFIDSDDYVDSRFVEVLLELCLSRGVEIAQCDNTRNVSLMGSGFKKTIHLRGKEAFVKLVKFKTISPTAWGKLYRTSLFYENNLIFPVGRIHEDTAVLYKLIYHAKEIACIESTLYYYRLNDNSITTASYTSKHYESVTQYHNELDSFIAKERIDIKIRVINKHKALRLLSVLNKLALNNEEKSHIYQEFKQQYRLFTRNAQSVVCIVGLVPVISPIFFKVVKNVSPKIRKVLGKV